MKNQNPISRFLAWDENRVQEGKFPVASAIFSVMILLFISLCLHTSYQSGFQKGMRERPIPSKEKSK